MAALCDPAAKGTAVTLRRRRVWQVRHPLYFASSMMRFSSSVGLLEWVGVWSRYMDQALDACAGQPLALVRHSELVRQPEQALRALHARLASLGVALPPFDPSRRMS